MLDFSEKLHFVIISQQPWEEKNTGSNIWDIAQVLAQNHQVLLVNQSLDWSSLFAGKPNRFQLRNDFIKEHDGKRLVEVQKNFWLYSPKHMLGSFNWVPDSPVYDWLNRYNGYRLADEIKATIRHLQWDDYILLNDNDMLRGFYLKEYLKPSLYVYYLRDNLLATTYWQRHGKRLEPLLFNKINLIASNSLHLADLAGRFNPNSVYVGQGCDLTLFDPAKVDEEPADLAKLPRPRIGYAGAITQLRLDVDLIEAVATRRPDWQIVLIGLPDDSFPAKKLQALPNLTFLGPKPINAIPTYLAHMDVLINPQVLNEVTVGNYPRKIDEYLAMGKPVVAVKTDTMALFDQHVFLAETADEFITGIANALEGRQLSSSSDRIAFALEHSWENSAGSLLDAIDKMRIKKKATV